MSARDIPILQPIPQESIDTLKAGVKRMEALAKQFEVEGVDEMNQPINRCRICGCTFTYDVRQHKHGGGV